MLAEWLGRAGIPVAVCVATAYGQTLMEESPRVTVHAGRLTTEEMEALFEQEGAPLIIDATHPYAVAVSENIRRACEETGREYLRLLRAESAQDMADCVLVHSVEEAVDYLKGTEGNVLVTTGSKELHKFTAIPGYEQRIFARVLSTKEVAAQCAELGFAGRNLICMQGPFSLELNVALLKEFDAKYLVTKDSGSTGGFAEKQEAARQAGATLVLIGRPTETGGKSYGQVQEILRKRFSISEAEPGKRNVACVGIGMGSLEGMTGEAVRACQEADVIIGAGRMLENTSFGKPVFQSYKPEEIRDFCDSHLEYGRIAIVLSGDVGFYSGAKKLLQAFAGGAYEVKLLPGISSVVYLCSRLQMAWEDVKLLSLHGLEKNFVQHIKRNKKTFLLLGNGNPVAELCEKLQSYGLSKTEIYVGERLGYPEEKITKGTPETLAEKVFDGLSVALVVNPEADALVPSCIPDEDFIRGKAPMTKSEVRSLSVDKLRLPLNALVYDIGAGTGSVTVELALQAVDGMVYAIEKQAEAADLILENAKKFAAPNIQVVRGLAPEALKRLPAPTHAFIGGSSGNLKEIMELLLQKNPRVRMVINTVTLETIGEVNQCLKELPLRDVEIIQVSIAKAKALGSYQLMMGQNPVYIVSCEGEG